MLIVICKCMIEKGNYLSVKLLLVLVVPLALVLVVVQV